MSLIEQAYNDRLASLTPQQRVEQCAALYHWTREMIGRQILAEMGPLSAERLKWEVAKRIYAADPGIQVLIERKLADVSP